MAVLPPTWFQRPTLVVAEELMGRTLCRRIARGTIIRSRITEVEAYDGAEDKACHAHKGKTPRNAIMFDPGGFWYVYLCYGVHWLLNITVGPKDFPAAVLIRGVDAASGPGRLTRALQIDQRFQNLPARSSSGLWIEAGPGFPTGDVKRTPRIGIGYAGEWVHKPYRWVYDPDDVDV